MHSMKICDRCKINKRGVQYCCRNGHHDATRRKPGPKVGSKRLVEEQGQVSHKRRRMQGSVSDRGAARDSTPPTAPTLSNMRPRSNSAPQLGGASSASLYLAALGPRPGGGGGMHKCTPPRASRTRERSTPGHGSGERPKRARAVVRGREEVCAPPSSLYSPPPSQIRTRVRHRSTPVTPVTGEQPKRLRMLPHGQKAVRSLAPMLTTLPAGHGRSSTSST